MDKFRIILKPVVTEKSLERQKSNFYSFWVDRRANKNQIRGAIKELFKVKPLTVRTALVKGRIKRLWRENKVTKTSDRKKAIIKLPKGSKISLMVSRKIK